MRRISAWLLGLSVGCSSSAEVSAPEVEVVIDGDPEVLSRLHRVRASVHALDSLTEWKPLHQHDFVLAKGAEATRKEVLPPITFGIVKGEAERFELVIEGFEAPDERAIAVIEHKQRVTFRSGPRRRVQVTLAASCYALSRPCASLAETCDPASRACAPVGEASEASAPDAGAETRPEAADTTAERAADEACPADNPCSPDYPCVVTEPTGYTCLGQMADWPMPIVGSEMPPAYDYQTDPRVVVDQVTGLVWQREVPATYPGCTGTLRTRGDTCTWDEAKRYCQQLQLADRKWRLPTKIELESLLDTSAGAPTLVEPAFTPLPSGIFWTASVNPFSELSDGKVTQTWNLEFFEGASGFAKPEQPSAVRCVSGIPRGGLTPAERYQVDMASDTVSDRRTGLAWRRTTSSGLRSLADAQRYCAALGDGFRVPSLKEMLTLIDPTKASPAADPVFAFASYPWGWAAEVRADGGVDEWYIDVIYGASYSKNRFGFGLSMLPASFPPPHVRCVR